MRILSLFFLSCLSLSASAKWQLSNEASQVNFISIKKNSIAEIHHFKQLAGSISEQGKVEFTIDLASVETNIPIRNERMQTFLFETAKYAKAMFSAQIDMALVTKIASGQSETMTISGALDLHGQKQNITTDVLVTKKSTGEVTVTSIEPIIVNAADFELVKGINKLQELAKLPSIAVAVPVTFQLTFK